MFHVTPEVLTCIIIIITTGVIYIKTLLMKNKTLQVLNIGWNQIGNEGVATVCKVLHNNTNITKLRMDDCGISVEGIYIASHVASCSCKTLCGLMMITKCVVYSYSVCKPLSNLCQISLCTY